MGVRPAKAALPAQGKAPSRGDIVARYRRWRGLRKDNQSAALGHVSRSALLGHAKRIGLSGGKVFTTDSDAELTLAYDLAVYTARAGRPRAIDRCARSRRNGQDPDEALLLEALCASRFSVFRAVGRRQPVGVRLEDLMRGGEVWLLDEGLQQSAEPGALFPMRVAPIERFVVTCGAVIPLDHEPAKVLAGVEGDDDAALAVLAMERGYVLYSTDTDFARFAGLRWANPCKR